MFPDSSKQRAAVAAMIRTVLARETEAGAFSRWDRAADTLGGRDERIGALLDAAREDVLPDMDHPKARRAQIAGGKPLQRLTKAIRRPAEVVGRGGSRFRRAPPRRRRQPPGRGAAARAIRRGGRCAAATSIRDASPA